MLESLNFISDAHAAVWKFFPDLFTSPVLFLHDNGTFRQPPLKKNLVKKGLCEICRHLVVRLQNGRKREDADKEGESSETSVIKRCKKEIISA